MRFFIKVFFFTASHSQTGPQKVVPKPHLIRKAKVKKQKKAVAANFEVKIIRLSLGMHILHRI